jgi:predicted branched-subunit amino acid permease
MRRDAGVLGAAVGVFGVSFGVLATTAGLTVAQACAMSLLVFTGASQFATVGLVPDARAAGLAVAIVATWCRAPFVVVVAAAAATTAVVRAVS